MAHLLWSGHGKFFWVCDNGNRRARGNEHGRKNLGENKIIKNELTICSEWLWKLFFKEPSTFQIGTSEHSEMFERQMFIYRADMVSDKFERKEKVLWIQVLPVQVDLSVNIPMKFLPREIRESVLSIAGVQLTLSDGLVQAPTHFRKYRNDKGEKCLVMTAPGVDHRTLPIDFGQHQQNGKKLIVQIEVVLGFRCLFCCFH